MNDANPSRPASHRTADTPARTARIATTVALVLLVIGGLDWALVGLFNLDFVAALFGPMTLMSRMVYALVGVAAVYGLTLLPRINRSLP